MTPTEYLAALERLGLSGQQAADFFEVDRATVWRWRTGDGPPAAVAKLLAVMVARKLSVAKVDDLQLTAQRVLRRRKAIL